MDELFAQRLKEAIKKCGVTQKVFAAKSGISASYLTEILKGRTAPSERVVRDICRNNSLSEEWLLTGEGEMRPQVQGQTLYLPPEFARLMGSDSSKGIELSEEAGLELLADLYLQLTVEGKLNLLSAAGLYVKQFGKPFQNNSGLFLSVSYSSNISANPLDISDSWALFLFLTVSLIVCYCQHQSIPQSIPQYPPGAGHAEIY